MRSVQIRVGRNGLRNAALASASLLALTVGAVAQQSTQLDEISVAGAGGNATAGRVLPGQRGPNGRLLREDPRGPIDGFVATRSASATKTDTPLIETPQSITVIGTEQIQAQGAQTLIQATAYAAGTYAGTNGPDQRQDYFLLRGFVAQDYGLYKDGLQLLQYGFGTFQTELFGLERIEVLRGPAAVLFGAGNPGGLINQVTKRPTLTSFGHVEVGGGSFGQVYGAFDFGGPADASGHWFYRLTGIGRMGGTQVDGADSDRAYIAPSITYRPDAGTSFTVLTSYQRDSTAVTQNFLPYSGSVRPNASGLRIPRSLNIGDPNINTFQRQQAFVGYEFEHAVDATWTVRQNLRYSFSEASQNTYIANNYVPGTNETQLNRFQFAFHDRINLFQVDNQAEARFSDGFFNHDMIFGVDYKNFTLRDNQKGNFSPFYSVPALDLLNPNFGPPVGAPAPYLIDIPRFTQVGLYFQDQVKLTDRLSLIGGLRQDFATTDVKNVFNAFPPPPGQERPRRDDQALTGRIALLYNFDPGIAPYVVYSTSFQPQIGFDSLQNGRALVPDRGEQIEVGVKIEPVGERYSFTFAAFDLVRDNPPIPVLLPNFGTTQQGSVRSRGVEAQFLASLAEGLNVVANFTHYDIEYIKSQQEALIGKTPVAVPQTFASAFLDYTVPTGEYRGFGLGGGVRYVGHSYGDNANTLKVPEYVLFDATVHYDWGGHWRAAITAANIGDRRFVASCQSEGASCFYGEARRVIASVAYRW